MNGKVIGCLVVMLCAMCTFLVWTRPETAQGQTVGKVQRWEFKLIPVGDFGSTDPKRTSEVLEKLNQAGAEGWDYVVSPTFQSILLKRPKG